MIDTVPSTRVEGRVIVDSAIVVTDSVRITDDINVYGDVNLRGGGINFDNTLGISFTPSTATTPGILSFGKPGNPAPYFDPCSVPNSPSAAFTFPSSIAVYANGATGYTGGNILSMSSWHTGSSIDVAGLGGLLVNYFCGKNIYLGTGTGNPGNFATNGTAGSKVYVGDELYSRKNLQVGNDWTAIDPNVSLNVYSNPGMDGIKLNNYDGTAKLINSTFNNFVVYGNGNVHMGQALQIGFPNSSMQYINASININANSSEGVRVVTGFPNFRAYWIENSSSNSTPFAIYGNGNAHLGSAVQIGFSSNNIQDVNTALNVNVGSGKGVKFTTWNNAAPLISIENSNAATVGQCFTVYGNGRTYIGKSFPKASGTHNDAMLSVDGKVLAKSAYINIHNSTWADYVFESNYKLMPLQDVEAFLKANKHLPDVPSEKELTSEEYNLNISEMLKTQMAKIEELFLYTIKQQKEIDLLKKENKELKQLIRK